MKTLQDGPYLKRSRWFDEMDNGTLRMKRVSKEKEEQFPKKYRQLYQKHHNQLGRFMKLLMEEWNCTLGDAWVRVKNMFND